VCAEKVKPVLQATVDRELRKLVCEPAGGRMPEGIVLADDDDLFKRVEMVAQNLVILYQRQSNRRGGPIAT
jgi:hypothetical protein